MNFNFSNGQLIFYEYHKQSTLEEIYGYRPFLPLRDFPAQILKKEKNTTFTWHEGVKGMKSHFTICLPQFQKYSNLVKVSRLKELITSPFCLRPCSHRFELNNCYCCCYYFLYFRSVSFYLRSVCMSFTMLPSLYRAPNRECQISKIDSSNFQGVL